MTLSVLSDAEARAELPTLSFRVLPSESGLRLDRYLHRRVTWRSRNEFQAMIRSGEVRVNGATRKPSSRLAAGDRVDTPVPDPERMPLREVVLSVDVPFLWEDEWLFAVNKPPLVPVHPTRRYLNENLHDALAWRFRDAGFRPQHLHRLDRETSGVLLYAKDRSVIPHLQRQFEGRKVHKEYLALVHGRVRAERGTVQGAILRSRTSRICIKREVTPAGRPSVTDYAVEERAGAFTLLRLFPKTGRSHQIRVHLAHIGHPIVGDKIYGKEEAFFLRWFNRGMDPGEAAKRLLLPRQALHAARLRFLHPVDGRERDIEAPLPGDMAGLLAALREGRAGEAPLK
jgi:23S rRNA pseudouridine1911/1915/1917 synthase